MPRNGKLNSEEAALDWLDRGIQPIPIKPRGKRPKGKNWPRLRVTESTVADHFKPGDNIGGLWGEPSGWIVDVDLDDEDAADLAEYVLPKTFIFGRGNRPDTHFLYRSKNAETQKWKGPKKEMIVELRSSGTQTVLPPSIHPDGDDYIISEDAENVAKLSSARLNRYLNQLAVGALFVRNFPRDGGSRHDYIHAVTGALLYSKWKPTEVRRLARAIVQVTQEDDDDSAQRIRTIENTITKFKDKDRVLGWPSLKDWISSKELLLMKRWAGEEDLTNIPPITTKKVIKAALPSTQINFDKTLLDVPGLVGEATRWVASQAYRKQPAFDLATGLMCTALASCNHYEIDGWRTPLQPYFMLTVKTAMGKGASMAALRTFAREVKLQSHVYDGFLSYHSMMDQLAEEPNIACWILDEAARFLKASRHGTGQDAQVITHLLKLYGQANSYMGAMPGRGHPIPALENPFLLLFSASQPELLIDAMSGSDIAAGFPNRVLLFSGSEQTERNRNNQKIFPSKLKKLGMRLVNHEPKGSHPTPVRLADVKTVQIFENFDDHAIGTGDDMWGRANQNALIAAGLVAVGVSASSPKITAEIASWATKLVTWSIRSWKQVEESLSSSNFYEAKSKQVEQIISNPLKFVLSGVRAQQIAFLKRGFVPRSIITRHSRGITPFELDQILEQLIEAELIVEKSTPDGKGKLYTVHRH
jgi:hypothetical protein